MSALLRYLPWTPQLVCLLLNLVITEGAHIAKKSYIIKKWNSINDSFFNQNETQGFKAEMYKKDDPRKLRDMYKQVMASCKVEIDRLVIKLTDVREIKQSKEPQSLGEKDYMVRS